MAARRQAENSFKPETLKLMWTDQLGDIPGYDDRKNGNGFGLGSAY